jgi:hypothetical protein
MLSLLLSCSIIAPIHENGPGYSIGYDQTPAQELASHCFHGREL